MTENVIVYKRDGQPAVSSRDVAEQFGKEHRNVIQSIKNLIAENSALTFMFIEDTYTAGTGKKYPMYYMNRDGFALLAMGFTGKGALAWKLKYIQAFNMMEEKLKAQEIKAAMPPMEARTMEAQALLNPDTMIQFCQQLKAEQDKNKALTITNSQLTVDKQIMQPKADYFDELVDRNLLTSFRETAKQLEIGEKSFIQFLLDKKYIYRDKKGKLMPYAEKNNGLFEVKECFNEKTQWSGTQTLVTPKGRETLRLLYIKTP